MILIFSDTPIHVTAQEVQDSMERAGIRIGVGHNNQLGECVLAISQNCSIGAWQLPSGMWFGDGIDCNFKMRLPLFDHIKNGVYLKPEIYLSWASIDVIQTDPIYIKRWVEKLVDGGVSEILKA